MLEHEHLGASKFLSSQDVVGEEFGGGVPASYLVYQSVPVVCVIYYSKLTGRWGSAGNVGIYRL